MSNHVTSYGITPTNHPIRLLECSTKAPYGSIGWLLSTQVARVTVPECIEYIIDVNDRTVDHEYKIGFVYECFIKNYPQEMVTDGKEFLVSLYRLYIAQNPQIDWGKRLPFYDFFRCEWGNDGRGDTAYAVFTIAQEYKRNNTRKLHNTHVPHLGTFTIDYMIHRVGDQHWQVVGNNTRFYRLAEARDYIRGDAELIRMKPKAKLPRTCCGKRHGKLHEDVHIYKNNASFPEQRWGVVNVDEKFKNLSDAREYVRRNIM